ncbi:MogA/MoaB family molybdenum cofactor biosynthesis protein [Desulfococcus multivorans]|uniref:Molybdenum cofactor biosynthesis protein B n=1 Tax=Desulfococcus multivorans DSM 2059 TaxID=1121405 RepID=S7THE5_DESML|nr:MogA/MoaB family molybdenum cofactor biosynthesis protein [Desulfococcus multivorans]AOY60051.1 MoaB: molybdenum cofactor biosynthesis protein B [Desulfococcus multivorans]AQV02190.1 molybdenum cofactor biosynthesis protein [Desulfococcus multivorans]EPR36045.1 molybdenum cofactor synthesis domain containing protein [Desulfococcus multivorans DSM 2059]SJZ37508.1 molybdenum cofactor biosynthesis protein B [Desulfococcus multivorans DSM 2059]
MGVEEHKKGALKRVRLGIVTLSTTRGPAEDESGNWMAAASREKGHEILFHRVLPDDAAVIRETLLSLLDEHDPDAVLMNGGTGADPADVTIEAVHPLFRKELTAFGALFAQLSYADIGAAALISRASAGIIGRTAVFCMPGSIKACRLACDRLVFPELGHLVKHIRTG